MTYKEVPMTMGPTLNEEEMGPRGMARKESGHAKKTGLPPKREESVDGFEQASDLIRYAF